MKTTKVTLFKPEDFLLFKDMEENIQKGLKEYLDSLNEILNDEDYWDWKPLLVKLINGNGIRPLWHFLRDLTEDSGTYIFEFVIPNFIDKKAITKEFKNILNSGEIDDQDAIIAIQEFGTPSNLLISITKYFNI